MNERQKAVSLLCDGVRSSGQIALMLNDRQKYVQEIMRQFDLPRRKRGSANGEMNHAYKGGRRIDRDGYVLVSAPINHPHARHRANRVGGVIYEHRLVMEEILGRHLTRSEIVDHIDGLRLHNNPSNLRLFENNALHLKATITNQTPKWSKAGRHNMTSLGRQSKNYQPVDTYRQMKRNGDARLRQILHAMLLLGTESPYLLGTSHHLKKAGISDLSDSNLEHELVRLCQKYA